MPDSRFCGFYGVFLVKSAGRSITNAPAACLEYSHFLESSAYMAVYDCFKSPEVINMYLFPSKYFPRWPMKVTRTKKYCYSYAPDRNLNSST